MGRSALKTYSDQQITGFRRQLHSSNAFIPDHQRQEALVALIESRMCGREDLLNYFLSACISARARGEDIFDIVQPFSALRSEYSYQIYEALRREHEDGKHGKYKGSVSELVDAHIAQWRAAAEDESMQADPDRIEYLALAHYVFPHPFEHRAFTPKDQSFATLATYVSPEFLTHCEVLKSQLPRLRPKVGHTLALHYLVGAHDAHEYAFLFAPSSFIDDDIRKELVKTFMREVYDRCHHAHNVVYHPVIKPIGADMIEILARDFGDLISPANSEIVDAINDLRASHRPFLAPILEHQLFLRGFTDAAHYARFLHSQLDAIGLRSDDESANAPWRLRPLQRACDVLTHTRDPFAAIEYAVALHAYSRGEYSPLKMIASLNPVPTKEDKWGYRLRNWPRDIRDHRRDELIDIARELTEYRRGNVAAGFGDVYSEIGDEITRREAPYVTEMYARLAMTEDDRIRIARALIGATSRENFVNFFATMRQLSDDPSAVRDVAKALRADIAEGTTTHAERACATLRERGPLRVPTYPADAHLDRGLEGGLALINTRAHSGVVTLFL